MLSLACPSVVLSCIVFICIVALPISSVPRWLPNRQSGVQKCNAGSPIEKKLNYFLRREKKKCFLVLFLILNKIQVLQRQDKNL